MYIPLSFLISDLVLRTRIVPGSPEPPLLTKKGSDAEKVMSFPSGPIKLPTFALDDPDSPWKVGMVLRPVVVMRLLLGRTSPPRCT